MKKLIVITALALALGFFGLSQIKGQSEEKGQEKTEMTQMMQNQGQMMGMMKDMNTKMANMMNKMNSCMEMMQMMHSTKGGMMQHHEGMMEKK